MPRIVTKYMTMKTNNAANLSYFVVLSVLKSPCD